MNIHTKLWHPEKTVFVQIKNSNLRMEIVRWATNLGFEVFYGSGIDLIAVGHLFAIVDKQEIGATVWNTYLDYLRESADPTPCMVINTTRHELEADIPSLYYEPKPDLMDWTLSLNDLLRKRVVVGLN